MARVRSRVFRKSGSQRELVRETRKPKLKRQYERRWRNPAITLAKRQASLATVRGASDMAMLSELAYKGERARSAGYNGYTYNPALSSEETAVFERDGKVVIASRGTYLGSPLAAIKDFSTDVLLAMNALKSSGRYRELDERVGAIVGEWGAENVILTGHSLGGTLAHGIAEKHSLDSFAFNPGASLPSPGLTPLEAITRLFGKQPKQTAKRYSFITGSDPISGLEALNSSRTIVFHPPNPEFNAHTIRNFLTKEQQDDILSRE